MARDGAAGIPIHVHDADVAKLGVLPEQLVVLQDGAERDAVLLHRRHHVGDSLVRREKLCVVVADLEPPAAVDALVPSGLLPDGLDVLAAPGALLGLAESLAVGLGRGGADHREADVRVLGIESPRVPGSRLNLLRIEDGPRPERAPCFWVAVIENDAVVAKPLRRPDKPLPILPVEQLPCVPGVADPARVYALLVHFREEVLEPRPVAREVDRVLGVQVDRPDVAASAIATARRERIGVCRFLGEESRVTVRLP